MSTKNNPGAYDCYAKLGPDEPYFVLRAKDPQAAALVREWVARRRAIAKDTGVPITPEYEAKLAEATYCADEMERWRRERS